MHNYAYQYLQFYARYGGVGGNVSVAMSDFEIILANGRARRRLPDPEERRFLRKRAGLTQQQVADALGVSRVSVTLWESGRRSPGKHHWSDYLALLDRLAAEIGGGDV